MDVILMGIMRGLETIEAKRVFACEVMKAAGAVRSLNREGKIFPCWRNCRRLVLEGTTSSEEVLRALGGV